jgi:hypothetical protein
MKNTKPLFIVIIILFIIGLTWILISRDKPTIPIVSPDEEISEEINEDEQRRQEALIRWQTNCEDGGGTWITEYEMCYSQENAERLRESCEAINGTWIEDSMIYECEINGEMFKLGEWEMIDWKTYDEMKQSCLDSDGEWIGGADMACSINSDVFYMGGWMVLDEMEESCVNKFGGEWLGGESAECEIDGVVYPGNWVQIYAMKDSCEEIGGEWLGGEKNECRVNGQIYSQQSWERIDEMKESCEEIGGEYIGGDRFRCDWEDDVYFDKKWERAALAPSMEERCIEDGGSWDEGRRSCDGLEKDWCDNILVELDLGAVGWNDDSLSCILY